MINAIAVSPIDGTIAAGSRVGEVFLWNELTGRVSKILPQQANVIGSLTFSADGRKLLTTSAEGSNTFPQRVWDVEQGVQLITYDAHDDAVSAAAISPDQRLAITAGGRSHEIHIWNFATGKLAQGPGGDPLILRGDGNPIFSVGFSANGKRLLWGDTPDYKS